MSNHTKGPWEIRDPESNGWKDVNGAAGGEVCTVYDADGERGGANIKLIAVAPEMYEILELYDTLITSEATTPSDNETHWKEATDKVRGILKQLYVSGEKK